MTIDIQQLWKNYEDAWRDIAPEERQRLLVTSVAEDVTFTGPDNADSGKAELTAMLEDFQRNYPGAWFKTTSLIGHHQQLLASWSMCDKTNVVILIGKTYARWNEEGLITHLAGFWEA